MNINSIYPKGFEKTGPCNPNNHAIDKNVRDRAITMLKDNKTVEYISKELNVNLNTVNTWKRLENNKKNY